jgi:arylsulfatase A-like enzyme
MKTMLSFTVLLAVAVLAPCPALAEGPRKPNLLILLADDLGYADVGFHGCKDVPTPHLDALAAGGVRCTQGYVSGVYCSPTRAGLLTGRYQQRFGHEFNPGGGAAGLPLSETTLADRLKQAGYVTGLVGKWHLGNAPQFHPQKRGFDEFFGFLGGARSFFPDPKADPLYRGTQPVEQKEYLTDAFAREAVSFIDRHKEKPFFLYLAFNAVHTPMHATEAGLQRFPSVGDRMRRTYAAMLASMDDAVGQVMAKLRSAGLEEHTLVVFFSDNGGPTMQGTTINASRNTPLRGSKRTTLEGGVRVPFVWSWKGKLPAGKVYEPPMIQLDILPTALAAAGAPVGPEARLDGVDLLPYLTGKAAGVPHETLSWRMGPQMAIRQGDWKLVKYDRNVEGPVQKSERKAGPPVTAAKLYNLAADVGEANDLAAKHPEKVQELEATWQRWNAQLAKPLWGAGSKAAAKGKAR